MKAVPFLFVGLILLGGADATYHHFADHVVAAAETPPAYHASVLPQAACGPYPMKSATCLTGTTGTQHYKMHVPYILRLHHLRIFRIRRIGRTIYSIRHPVRSFFGFRGGW